MTAQNHEDLLETPAGSTDPIGPVHLPVRTRIGARALALTGALGVSTLAIAALSNDVCSTWPTISAN